LGDVEDLFGEDRWKKAMWLMELESALANNYISLTKLTDTLRMSNKNTRAFMLVIRYYELNKDFIRLRYDLRDDELEKFLDYLQKQD
jgi:hypothetical protein